MKNIFKYLLLLGIIFVNLQLAIAEAQFQHNLLKMDVYKTSLGAVKVTLYTNKPYSDNVVVNKKTDTEYVILMPETLNSMTAKPALSPVSDVVKDINVKTQQYNSQGKGYTKITVSTLKPVEITPQVQTISGTGYQISEKDYKELLNNISKKPAVSRKVSVATKPTSEKLASAKRAPEIKKQKSESKQESVAKAKKQILKKETAPKQNNITQPSPRPAVKAAEKVAENVVEKATVVPVATKPAEPVVEQQAPIQQVVPLQNQPQAEEQKSSQVLPEPVLGKFEQYKNIIKNNIYTALGLIVAAFIILLLGARKMLRNSHASKKIFTENLKEQPQTPKDYTENIEEDMTWKEKFQTYTDADNEVSDIDISVQGEQPPVSENSELNNLFAQSSEDYEGGVDSEFAEDKSSSLDDFLEPQELYETADVDSIFEDDETEEFDREYVQEEFYYESISESISDFSQFVPQEEEKQEEIIKSEFKIDDKSGFYLVDFEDTSALVGHIDDEIFVLKRFNEKVNQKIQARFNEKKGATSSYMTRVGSFKAIVEVSPENMNLLIEL